MSYINASDILPDDLIAEIQKYLDGQLLYIPRKEKVFSWGEKCGSREKLIRRNQQIFESFKEGKAIQELSREYCLSEKRIQGIVYGYGSSMRKKEKVEDL